MDWLCMRIGMCRRLLEPVNLHPVSHDTGSKYRLEIHRLQYTSSKCAGFNIQASMHRLEMCGLQYTGSSVQASTYRLQIQLEIQSTDQKVQARKVGSEYASLKATASLYRLERHIQCERHWLRCEMQARGIDPKDTGSGDIRSKIQASAYRPKRYGFKIQVQKISAFFSLLYSCIGESQKFPQRHFSGAFEAWIARELTILRI